MQIETKLENATGIALAGERSGERSTELAGQLTGGVRGAVRALGSLAWETLTQALALVIAAFERLRRSGARSRRLRVVETLALGGRRQLVLVLCDEQEYLVGMGVEGVETIVSRQPGAAIPEPMVPGVPAQAVPAKKHSGAMLRERPANGPWLVTPGGRGVAENRIREVQNGAGNGAQNGAGNGAQSGMGQELWQ